MLLAAAKIKKIIFLFFIISLCQSGNVYVKADTITTLAIKRFILKIFKLPTLKWTYFLYQCQRQQIKNTSIWNRSLGRKSENHEIFLIKGRQDAQQCGGRPLLIFKIYFLNKTDISLFDNNYAVGGRGAAEIFASHFWSFSFERYLAELKMDYIFLY